MISLDNILLGHNQFYGVSHMSLEKGEERRKQFENINNVMEIINFTNNLGIKNIMLSTHDNVKPIIDQISLNSNFSYYPLLPYMRKYLNLYNQLGHYKLFLNVMNRSTFQQKIVMSMRMLNPFQSTILKLIRNMIDIELHPFNSVKVKAVFLHNILTDFLVALDQDKILNDFIIYTTRKGVKPAFCTLNLPSLVKKLNNLKIDQPIIMSPFNKVGYQMNPSREKCEQVLRDNPHVKLIAMSTLASGYLKPEKAYKYIFEEVKGISGVVVGVSTKIHAQETFQILRRYTQ